MHWSDSGVTTNERKMIDIPGYPVLDAVEIVESAVLIVFGIRLIQARCAKLGWPAMAAAVAFAGMAGAPVSIII